MIGITTSPLSAINSQLPHALCIARLFERDAARYDGRSLAALAHRIPLQRVRTKLILPNGAGKRTDENYGNWNQNDGDRKPPRRIHIVQPFHGDANCDPAIKDQRNQDEDRILVE